MTGGDQSKVIPRRYRGRVIFGFAYARMLASDSHAPGSVDQVLTDKMVLLCDATAPLLYSTYTPLDVRYQRDQRPTLERFIAAFGVTSAEELVGAVTGFCAAVADRAPDGLDALRLGGTEEQIIERGSDWCTDLARVACALCQVAGLPARLVYLADTAQAYSGHTLIEVYRARRWGACDPTYNVVYRHHDGTPASTWEIQRDPVLLEAHKQFRSAAIANYYVWDRDQYDYTVSSLNAYYQTILEQAQRGWPGGLRWLHGEDLPATR